MTAWLLGIDIGASSIKCTQLDIETGLATVTRKAIATEYPQAGWAQQNPIEWIEVLRQCLSCYTNNPPQAITVSAGTHIPVLLDNSYKPIRPAILWSDQRSHKQAQYLQENYKEYIEKRCGNTPSATWSLAMLRWLKENEPQSIERCRHVLFAKDYIRFVLTGELATDRGDATGSMLAFQKNNRWQWDDILLDLAGLSRSHMPTICSATALAGLTTEQARSTLGIASGIPVFVGSIDTTVELISAGAMTVGVHTLKLATAGVYSWLTDQQSYNPRASCYPHINNNMGYFATGTNSCMSSLHWFAKTFIDTNGASLAQLDALATQASPDNSPLFHPYLLGERAPLWNSRLRAAFSSLSINHGLADIALSVYLGIGYSLRHLIEQSGAPQPHALIRVIGGGTASPLLLQTISAILDRPVIVIAQNDASTGAAMLAGLAKNIYDETAIGKLIQQTIVEADKARFDTYNSNYKRYLAMIASLEISQE